MDIRITNLSVRCRKENFSVDFSSSVTYFYGKMGAGKSTILRLIDFCLGNELVETPALQQEFIGADLNLIIKQKFVVLSRDKGSNQINVTWILQNSAESLNVIVPTKASADSKPIIPNTSIQTLSDLLFFLSEMQPPKVRKSKIKDDTELIRLSFRDLMWYCYLDQDQIDSSFFHLGRDEHEFKKLKSRDVMRLLLGFHQETVAQLETELFDVRRRKSTLHETADRIQSFLRENNIAETTEIEFELQNLELELESMKLDALHLRDNLIRENVHILDEHKQRAMQQSKNLDQLFKAHNDLTEQIIRRKKLHNEFNVAALKVSRSTIAQNLLRGIDYCNCPQCGQEIQNRINKENVCKLCLQDYSNEINKNEAEIIQADLRNRQSELKESIHKLERQLEVIERERLYIAQEKSITDIKINELERDYDSAYLAEARDLERQTGVLEGRKQELLNLLPLPMKIAQLYKEVEELGVTEIRLKNELEYARHNAEMDRGNLDELKSLFLENLALVGFPGINIDDYLEISTTDFIPRITRFGEDELFTTEFANLGSGGKKTIYKCCYILAIHRLAARKHIALPSFLLIDTPMKNISERENKDIFEGFYHLIYKLYSSELSDKQLIIIDKEFFSPVGTPYEDYFKIKDNFKVTHMTPDDPENPPLIQYYRGH
ncbi:AAA family ATPase [Paenibacillus sp. WQ 127069]|uniref:AAA family ATPase n=1 Tax=Paenibacillus baimaensis TaxID=2982185 RepID=A0ABT2UJN0_9BACL|nr:AAA family ATPase [Paenibacillus sp. WQ 127069]MCU6794854.1 AAA family ATPase [Paenibacillus sp. WQ 127069]